MYITADKSETRNTSIFTRHITPDCISLNLEKETGSDIAISPYPLNYDDVGKDVFINDLEAIFIQLKFGLDIMSINQTRQEIARMESIPPHQSYLLWIGDLKMNRQGKLVINGQHTEHNYQTAIKLQKQYSDFGVTVSCIQSPNYLKSWIDGIWSAAQDDDTKVVYKKKKRRIANINPSDYRSILIRGFDGIGKKTVDSLHRYMEKNQIPFIDSSFTLLDALMIITDIDENGDMIHTGAVNQGVHKKVRKALLNDAEFNIWASLAKDKETVKQGENEAIVQITQNFIDNEGSVNWDQFNYHPPQYYEGFIRMVNHLKEIDNLQDELGRLMSDE